MATIYTIGYEGVDSDCFRDTLAGAGIELVADVRAVALSRKRGFSKNVLRAGLAEAGIGYRHWIDLGTPKAGRDAARAGDAAGLRRIYCEQLATPGAEAALDELAAAAAERPTCLLCFERDPRFCHRRIVAERLAERGFAAVDLSVV
jgi:uncharacterized protein (DUF488 family)